MPVPLVCGVPGKSVEVLFCDMFVISFESVPGIPEDEFHRNNRLLTSKQCAGWTVNATPTSSLDTSLRSFSIVTHWRKNRSRSPSASLLRKGTRSDCPGREQYKETEKIKPCPMSF